MTDWTSLHGDSFAGSRAMVTGAGGFIGSHIAEALVKLGAQVIALDDLSGGERDNVDVAAASSPGSVEFVEASVLDESVVRHAMDGCRYVFHQAALPSVPRSIEIPRQFHEVNVTGTQALLDLAVETGVERVMFAASSSAYGDSETLPKIETMPALPKSPYAANKLAGEHLMRAYASCFDIDTASLRYFNIFGPRQNANSVYSGVIAIFAKMLLAGQAPTIYGDGEQSRDFTFVDNAVHANLLAAASTTPIDGEVINVACGVRITVNELVATMTRLMDRSDIQPVRRPDRAGDVKHSLADLARASNLLGYTPIVDFATGMDATVAWYRQALGAVG